MNKILTLLACFGLFLSPFAQDKPAAHRKFLVVTEENMGAGSRVFAGYNAKEYKLVSKRFLARAEWLSGAATDWHECHPVPEGVAQPACPSPVSEVGMDGVKEETGFDGSTLIGVNIQPGVAYRHWRVRIELALEEK